MNRPHDSEKKRLAPLLTHVLFADWIPTLALVIYIAGLVAAAALVVLHRNGFIWPKDRTDDAESLNQSNADGYPCKDENAISNLPILSVEINDGGLKFANRGRHLYVVDRKPSNDLPMLDLLVRNTPVAKGLQPRFQLLRAGTAHVSMCECLIHLAVLNEPLVVTHGSFSLANVRGHRTPGRERGIDCGLRLKWS